MNRNQNIKYVGFWLRFWADFIDGIIVLLIAVFFFYFIEKSLLGSNASFLNSNDEFLYSDLIILLVVLYNMTYLVGKEGQSWGRWLFNIKVVGYDYKPIGLWKALFRNLFAVTISACVFYLGFLWVIGDKKKQAWHDIVLKTYVVFL